MSTFTPTKEHDVLDLADIKGSQRSKFRDEQYFIVIDALDHATSRSTAKTIKSIMMNEGFKLVGPMASKVRNEPFSSKQVGGVDYLSTTIHRHVLLVMKSTYSGIDHLTNLTLPTLVNVKIEIDEGQY